MFGPYEGALRNNCNVEGMGRLQFQVCNCVTQPAEQTSCNNTGQVVFVSTYLVPQILICLRNECSKWMDDR